MVHYVFNCDLFQNLLQYYTTLLSTHAHSPYRATSICAVHVPLSAFSRAPSSYYPHCCRSRTRGAAVLSHSQHTNPTKPPHFQPFSWVSRQLVNARDAYRVKGKPAFHHATRTAAKIQPCSAGKVSRSLWVIMKPQRTSFRRTLMRRCSAMGLVLEGIWLYLLPIL